MNVTRRRLLGTAAAGAMIGLTGGTAARAFERRGDQKILVVAGRQSVPLLDPSVKYDASTRTFFQALYDALLKYEGNPPEVKPWLAESWEISDDGLTYTFKLVQGARFTNGDPVTAQAVKWSYDRTLKLGQGPSWMLSDFVAEDGIVAVDDHTFQIRLSKPFAPLLSFLPWWYVMNPNEVMAHEVDGDMGQKWLLENAAGSGPYKVRRFMQGTLYELERHDGYWRGFDGPLGGVIYKLTRESAAQRAGLIRGEVDIALDLTPEDFDSVARRDGISTSTEPALTAFGLKFNCTAEYTSNLDFRKALAYAYDYDAFVSIFNGRAVLQTSPFTDAIKGKIDVADMPRQDLAKAREHLAKTPWPDGGMELEYVYVEGFEEERQMGLVLIDSLLPLKIGVKMVPLTWPNMVARGATKETSPHLMAIFATPVSTDPDAVAIQYHPVSHGKYYGTHFWEDPEVTRLIEAARTETDWEKRAPMYAEIQKLIVAGQPEIFGMMRERRIAYRDWVKNYQYSPVRMTSEIDFYPLFIDS